MELAEARVGGADNDADLQAPTLLAVRGLTIRLGGVIALDDVSFEVPRGAICGLKCPSRIDRPVDKRRASHPLPLPRLHPHGARRVRRS